jgi:hypothetical protein
MQLFLAFYKFIRCLNFNKMYILCRSIFLYSSFGYKIIIIIYLLCLYFVVKLNA